MCFAKNDYEEKIFNSSYSHKFQTRHNKQQAMKM